jgi:sugar lactone lactonase YvrE
MRSKARHAGLLVAATVLLGCQVSLPASAPPTGPVRAKSTARLAEVTGVLRVPARLLGPDGATLVGPDGGTLVGPDGGTLVGPDGGTLRVGAAAAARRLLALEARGVRNARVYVADAGGNAIPSIPGATTDAQGRFRLRNLLPGIYMIVAEVPAAAGQRGAFRSLVRVTDVGASVEIDHATTLVTSSVVEGLTGGDLGGFNSAAFRAATDLTARSMKEASLPDFTDGLAVRRAMAMLARDVDDLRGLVGELRDDLSQLSARVEELEREQAASKPGGVNASDEGDSEEEGEDEGEDEDDPEDEADDEPGVVKPFVDPARALAAEAVLRSVAGLALDPDQDLCVADPLGKQVLAIWHSGGMYPIEASQKAPEAPTDVAASEDTLFIAASGAGGVWWRRPDKPARPVRFEITTVNFHQPRHLAVDETGTVVFTTSQDQHSIRRWTSQGTEAAVWVGSATEAGLVDGPARAARFNGPRGLALSSDGDLFVADTGNHRIRRVQPDGTVSTLAGSERGLLDGPGSTARFASPEGLGVDEEGNLYVADRGNRCIRRVKGDGTVTTLAGPPGVGGDATASAAFADPLDVAVDADGWIFVSDGGDTPRIWRFKPR